MKTRYKTEVKVEYYTTYVEVLSVVKRHIHSLHEAQGKHVNINMIKLDTIEENLEKSSVDNTYFDIEYYLN